MGLLQTLYVDGASDVPRVLQILREIVRHPARSAKLLSVHRWSERTVILLVMQSLDNSITTYLKRSVFGRYKYTSKQGGSEPPTFIPGRVQGVPADRGAYRRTRGEHMD
jgi:cholesterol oxidase